jgi:MoxR-like ATPase
MDDRRSLVLSENNNEVVKAQPGFVVVGSMNEGNGYGGTSLAHAFRDRFGPVLDLEYLPEDREARLLTERVDIEPMMAAKLVQIAVMLRRALAQKEVRTPTSTRALLECAKLIKADVPPLEAAKLTIVGKVPTTYPAERKAFLDTVEAVLANTVSSN